ncbi:MAG: quinol:cytochrome C oxidoreductase [Cytophagales bacterium]|nr:quinol:cytochrome C oxidoreductase [Cytophagales bacterium]
MEEKFEFTKKAKKSLMTMIGAGILLVILGIVLMNVGGHGEHEGGEALNHVLHWSKRLWANLWLNNVWFTGIALIGVFFLSMQYVAWAGWSVSIKRVPEAFGYFLPVAGVLMLIIFLVANHDLFHWTHEYLYDKNDARYDEILDGKSGFLNMPFFTSRMVGYFVLWFGLFWLIRKYSLTEDISGGLEHFNKLRMICAFFMVIFGVTSSMAAWDWIMSIDAHWFSTMIGWYVFSSWFVSGLCFITLIVIYLKQNGYLAIVNENHIHNLALFVFAFSVFWTYLWFCQFFLIYYANIPEESIYFVQRLLSDQYAPWFFATLIINFIFPFLALMTRDSKRHMAIVKIVCMLVLFGHWLDFYLMVMPGTVHEQGGIGFMEIGVTVIYIGIFLYTVLFALSKASLIAKHHPMLEESVHHTV